LLDVDDWGTVVPEIYSMDSREGPGCNALGVDLVNLLSNIRFLD